MRIGEYQELVAERVTPQGLYLSDDEAEVLLPQGQCPAHLQVGEPITVFVYTDSEDRPIATINTPSAVVGEFAAMEVVSATSWGAYLDWGLDKDLFLPMKEQKYEVQVGDIVLVRVYLDEVSQRVVCTTKTGRYLRQTGELLDEGEQVQIVVAELTKEFVSVIVNGHTRASIFRNELFEPLSVGERRVAYVKQIRTEDGRVALSLRPIGLRAVLQERDRVLDALKAAGGTLPVSDRSTPVDIHRRFGLSKGAFKKLIGTLYREGLIVIEYDHIRLADR